MSTLVGVVLIGLLIYVVIRVGAQSKPPSRGQVLARPPRVTVSVDTGSGGEVQFPSTTRHPVEPAKLARAADQRWIPPESNVTVANRRISGGMAAGRFRWRDRNTGVARSACRRQPLPTWRSRQA